MPPHACLVELAAFEAPLLLAKPVRSTSEILNDERGLIVDGLAGIRELYTLDPTVDPSVRVLKRLLQVQIECLPAHELVPRLDSPRTLFVADLRAIGDVEATLRALSDVTGRAMIRSDVAISRADVPDNWSRMSLPADFNDGSATVWANFSPAAGWR